MKRYLFVLLVLACTLPLWALDETVTVTAGDTETLPTTVSDDLQTLADDNGLTLLGWTTSPIADGHRPATYYGLGATVTPASNTTYYAFFARSANTGELIIRQTAFPADGDTVLLATKTGAYLLLASNGPTSDMQLHDFSSYYRGLLLTLSHTTANSNAWIYLVQPESKFQLQSVTNTEYYLMASTTAISSSNKSGNKNMRISSGFMYCTGAGRYLKLDMDGVGDMYWKPSTTLPSSQSFAFYRKERYVDFCTSITEPQPCPNCFIFTH